MREPLFDRVLPPREIDFLSLLSGALKFLGQVQEPLGCIGATVQDHIFAGFAQLGIEIVINRNLPGIHDAHVHAGFDGVIEKYRVHGLTHPFVSAEGERQVRNAA